ncbi:MAG: dihydropteroate synthase [Gammaproteobacteria bacterium]
MKRILRCGNREVDLSRPCVMGILNVTPDSFSDGGRYAGIDAALRQAARMRDEGAVFIDVGGESTRPGAAVVGTQQELDRVLPVVERIVREIDVCVSVDTSTPEVIREVAAAGAHLVNDVRALQRPGALAAAQASGLPVCLMHMQGEPGSMQQSPQYGDVVADVRGFLRERVAACVAAGIAGDRLLVDPGFGFGKTLAHNLALLARLDEVADELPLLVGVSRKSMVGALLAGEGKPPRPVDERLHGSVAAAVVAAMKGATILRVHDVAPTVDALSVVAAVQDSARKQ